MDYEFDFSELSIIDAAQYHKLIRRLAPQMQIREAVESVYNSEVLYGNEGEIGDIVTEIILFSAKFFVGDLSEVLVSETKPYIDAFFKAYTQSLKDRTP